MSAAVDNVFVANRTGAVGIIGEMSSSPTTAMALSASQFQLWQCSGSVTDPDLSDKSNVPFFMRTIPSDTFQGRMLARFVHLVQWHTVALLFSSDSYGTNLMSTFTDEAAKRNITIATSQSFSSTDPRTHAPAIAAIKTAGTRVVMFFGTADQFVALAREARAVSILGSDEWTWVGSDGLSGLLPLVADKSRYSNADRDLDGLLYAFPVEQGAAYAAFQTRFAAKYPTAMIHRYAVLYRDCLFAMARGIMKLAGRLSPATVLKRSYPSSISLADFLDPFDGTSGVVTYDANGDRLGDYAIVNVYGGKEETVFTLPVNGTKLVPGSAALKFYGGSSTIPSDVPKYRLGYPTWTSATGIVVMALTAIMIVVVVLTNLYLALNQHESSVKHMAMPFLTQISVGFVLLLSTVFLSIDVPTVGTCHAQAWTFVLGFELVISAVAAKTWRIWRVFDNAKLRKLAHLNNGRLFLGCLAIMAVQIVIMVVWTALAPVRPRKGVWVDDHFVRVRGRQPRSRDGLAGRVGCVQWRVAPARVGARVQDAPRALAVPRIRVDSLHCAKRDPVRDRARAVHVHFQGRVCARQLVDPVGDCPLRRRFCLRVSDRSHRAQPGGRSACASAAAADAQCRGRRVWRLV
ncbi:hypothetical protein AMAG_15833 [Allomyces macrogynus ATCC 38327]|uniref:G-protein coupled receptors family 3 profile domain-containing protein n=1 Tax=Allomyces macrogynus (strain ATCC 38327) TaxID=578462 RepID=A0A0L0T8X8_ALLM3|nr:hypothetical protein AMAG_15833 [Allomyces macrogynus ATCC 38327]|eukprot:KNE71171.1 hypothetical protein AMAG_15833 [Allomyces macrogynus ATCC 38327]